MAFSQTSITDVQVVINGADLFVSWSSTAPPGTIFQVYVDRRLACYVVSHRCHVPIPAAGLGRNIWVELGTVGAHEPTTDYSSRLVAPGGRTERARLSWSGGTYLDPTGQDDIQGFGIYQSRTPDTSINTTSTVDTVLAYPGGWINDGFGKGGFGEGGFGRAATLYAWQSGPLCSGDWQFAVVPFDKSGNHQGFGQTIAVTISAAPNPPGMNASGDRLTYTYEGPSIAQITLNWLTGSPE